MATPGVDLPPIPPIIAQLTGPLLLGHLFNWGLFGVLVVQCYIYYLAFPKDRPLSKSIVWFTFTIEVLQTVLSTRDAFRNFGSGWGNMAELDAVGWLWFSVPVLGSIISCLGQVFYAWRIWILSDELYIPGVVVVLSLLQFSTGLYSGARAHQIGRFSQVQISTYKTTTIWLGGTAACDIIIAASMMYYLSKAKTGFERTAALLTRFIRITVETGLICATFAILDLALFISFKENNYHLAPSIALSKLYSNSLLAVFNTRVHITGGRNPDHARPNSTLLTNTSTSYSGGSGSGFRSPRGSTTLASHHPFKPLGGPGSVASGPVEIIPIEGKDTYHDFQAPSIEMGPVYEYTHAALRSPHSVISHDSSRQQR
ncbi:hypothetical protein BXZ70DRAFT_1012681 [Cristinia sonorae]|uniref:DUF6534 domain-containing protein n=1 Tax=Cristinia sonorae TaxID=1940300 RepID=A0A8K0UE07_9AGAR|nr:hypothetical protein BXZ70DRAFT_1012681 [Cristinia sonorae]